MNQYTTKLREIANKITSCKTINKCKSCYLCPKYNICLYIKDIGIYTKRELDDYERNR